MTPEQREQLIDAAGFEGTQAVIAQVVLDAVLPQIETAWQFKVDALNGALSVVQKERDEARAQVLDGVTGEDVAAMILDAHERGQKMGREQMLEEGLYIEGFKDGKRDGQ